MRIDPTISHLLDTRQAIHSVEFFPPKDEAGVSALRATADALTAIKPYFASVTYGAGGTTRERSAAASDLLRREMGFVVMPHLTCVGATRNELQETIEGIHASGFRNIMALRGDPPKGETRFRPSPSGLRYGSDLVALINDHHPDICTGVAGYPEKHPEAQNLEDDLAHLKIKVDAGASFITTQLFFDNAVYFRFVERCREIGITVPIVPGLMPVLSLKQIVRFTEMCGASLPRRLVFLLERAGGDPLKVEEAGVDWAAGQILELIEKGAPGYHLYILNRSRASLGLAEKIAGF